MRVCVYACVHMCVHECVLRGYVCVCCAWITACWSCIVRPGFLIYWGRKNGSGALPIEKAVLASTLAGISVECDFSMC